MIKNFLLRLSKNIHWIFFVNFISALFDDTVNKILLYLDIIGWIISLFPKIPNCPPSFILIMNLIVFSFVIWKTMKAKKYKTLTESEATLLEHTYHINGMALSSDEKLLASCGGDNYAILWNNVQRRVKLRIPHDGWVGNVAFSPDNRFLFSLNGKSGVLLVWNCDSGHLEYGDEKKKVGVSRGLAIFPNENLVAVCRKDGTYQIFNPYDKNSDLPGKRISEVELKKIQISKKGLIATGNVNGELFLIKKSEDGEYVEDSIFQDERHEMIRNLVFDRESSKIAFTDSGGFLRILRISDHSVISAKAHNGHAIGVAFSPNGKFIASGGQDNLICVWELKQDVLKKRFEIQGHTDDVTCLLFDSHKHLYSASRDGSIKIWDLDGLY
ncbi:MAG: hypothetical protein PWQ55_491 [Chloroflexota bacterium]|nr:hypothetical protein [Chloroflexota bacterium]